jgi:4-hydroxy-tetrahydrodipicolinate reductase
MKIGILGAQGRMGKMLVRELESGAWPATLGAAVDAGGDAEAAFKSCAALIDFTAPEALIEHAALAVKHKKPLVVGTTGLGPKEEAALREVAKTAPVLSSYNMSLGVNLLAALVTQAAARLGIEFDIEVFEAHHRHKVDAPSGTALLLGAAAAQGRGVKLADVIAGDRAGARRPGDIGMSVFRGGDVVGDHVVTFAGAGERVELAHKASDRAIFAKGAIRAALWLQGKKPGFYTMRDVLEI